MFGIIHAVDILLKPISQFTFPDIIAFCQQGEREGIQIEYKRDLTTGSVSKSIAAFSNTRGGIIIIGVDEDRATGLPNAWTGIPNVAQNIERLHQWASNVDPLPSYEVHQTDEQNGNVFLLIRIFEGENTPYYVHNNPHLWVRTGNVATPIDYASPEQTKLLYQKRQQAANLRLIYISLSHDIWNNAVKRAERERKAIIANAAIRQDDSADGIATQPINIGNRPWLQMQIQPFSPNNPLAKPSEIKEKLQDVRYVGGNFDDFPNLNMIATSIPEGILLFNWDRWNGGIYCDQFYATGLIEQIIDIQKENREREIILVEYILGKMFVFFQGVKNFYQIFDYQGVLVGNAVIGSLKEGLVLTSFEHALMPDKTNLLPRYDWDLSLDTSILYSGEKFQEYFVQLVKEIFWSLGFGDISNSVIEQFLKKHHWHIS